MLQHVSKRPHGFLFVWLKALSPELMFQDSLVERIHVTEKTKDGRALAVTDESSARGPGQGGVGHRGGNPSGK